MGNCVAIFSDKDAEAKFCTFPRAAYVMGYRIRIIGVKWCVSISRFGFWCNYCAISRQLVASNRKKRPSRPIQTKRWSLQGISTLLLRFTMQRSLTIITTRGLGLYSSRATAQRCFSTTRSALQEKSKEKKNAQQNVFDPRFIGLTRDIYVPVDYKNLPSPFSQPKAVWNSLLRRLFTLGMNTIQVGLLRWQTGIKPEFLLWKNRAIEAYVSTNKAFASGNIKPIEKDISVWVEKSLKSRVSSIPKDVKLDWKLIKFNEKPKLVAFRPVMLPGRPVEYAQVVYKFNTKQELINVNLKTDKVKKIERDVTDYAGFVVNLDTDKVILAGTVFENTPFDRMPKPEDIDQSLIFEDMRINGDIYRAPPQIKSTTAEETK